MQTVNAVRGNARTFLTHLFGADLNDDDRYVVERFRSMASGEIRRRPGDKAPAKGRRQAKRRIVSVRTVSTGIVNTLHMQSVRLDRAVDRLAPELNTTAYQWYLTGVVTLVDTKLAIGYEPDARQMFRWSDGESGSVRLSYIAEHEPAHEARRWILDEIVNGARYGAMLSLLIVIGMLLVFWVQGRRLKRERRLRGAELVTARQLRRRVRPLRARVRRTLSGAPRPYRIAGIPYPERAETQHTIVSGTTGSGKTVLIADLVQQIRARGERCILYDKMGAYTRAFFEPGRDVLLNPLDARAPRWSPFFEARSARDFDTMAAALIPQQKDTVAPFWVTAARQLFSNGAAVLWKKGVKQNRVLVEHLLKTDLTELAKAMEGTVAQSIVDPDNPKTALSVRAMLTANIGTMEVLPDTGTAFSIRE